MANPTAMLLASANMLNHVNLQYYGSMIKNAVDRVIRVGKVSCIATFFISPFGEGLCMSICVGVCTLLLSCVFVEQHLVHFFYDIESL